VELKNLALIFSHDQKLDPNNRWGVLWVFVLLCFKIYHKLLSGIYLKRSHVTEAIRCGAFKFPVIVVPT
jgi:hypothetical protein